MRTTLLTIALLLLANDDAAARPAAQAQRVHQLLGQARVAAAARALAAISEAHASHPAVLAARGNVLFHQGRYAEAAKLLRRAVKASPRDRGRPHPPWVSRPGSAPPEDGSCGGHPAP